MSNQSGNSSSMVRNFFDELPDDIVLCILILLGSTADSPADFLAALLTCKKFKCLGLNELVLSHASAETFAVKPATWSRAAHYFLRRCADAGNVEASYTLGMIQFYCFHNYRGGAALMAKAAIRQHAAASYALAIIHFNGSGGLNRDLPGGVALCRRAALLGHVDAIRELGHCLKDGYGVQKNVAEGERLLIEAKQRDIAAISPIISGLQFGLPPHPYRANHYLASTNSPFEFRLPVPKCHPANRFLAGWNASGIRDPAYWICSYAGCGRLETKVHEFRRCAGCDQTIYCSRGCQSHDWTVEHNRNCRSRVWFQIVNAGRW